MSSTIITLDSKCSAGIDAACNASNILGTKSDPYVYNVLQDLQCLGYDEHNIISVCSQYSAGIDAAPSVWDTM